MPKAKQQAERKQAKPQPETLSWREEAIRMLRRFHRQTCDCRFRGGRDVEGAPCELSDLIDTLNVLWGDDLDSVGQGYRLREM